MTDERAMIWDRPNILLSVDPEWAWAILDGDKKWEYRRSPPNRTPPMRLVLYATAPVSAAVGAAFCGQVVEMDTDTLVSLTVDETPHDRADLFDYFDGQDTATALRIDSAEELDRRVPLDELQEDGPSAEPKLSVYQYSRRAGGEYRCVTNTSTCASYSPNTSAASVQRLANWNGSNPQTMALSVGTTVTISGGS